MMKIGLLALLVVILLSGNGKIGVQSGDNQMRYWAISCLSIVAFVISLLNVHVSISTYLTSFVNPIISFIYGGA